VSWTLRDADLDWLTTILGTGLRPAADAAEEHHGGLPAKAPVTSGTVTSGTVTGIRAVHCRYAPRPDGTSRTQYPVPGSGVLTEVNSADGWTPDRDGLKFAGYLVEVAS
jgi:hypothetical protein